MSCICDLSRVLRESESERLKSDACVRETLRRQQQNWTIQIQRRE